MTVLQSLRPESPGTRAQAQGGVLVAGLGSAGRRHLRSLMDLETGRPLGVLRSGHGAPPDADWCHLPEHRVLAAALAERPAAVVVANPTALHVPVALAAARAGCHLLVEKPLGSSLDGVTELRREVEQRNLVALVGYQFRFHPTLLRVRAWLENGAIGPVAAAQAHWGEALPDWHPGEDYRRGYSARRDLGGGALLTLSHTFDYLRFLLGDVESVSAEHGRLSGLELDVEDVASVTLRFAAGPLASVLLDYVHRPARHVLRLVGRAGVIQWTAADGAAYLWRDGSARPQMALPPDGFSRRSLFLAEMRHFLECLAGRAQPQCTLADGEAALRVALAALRSAEEGRRVQP